MPGQTRPQILSAGWRGEAKARACIIGLGLIGGSWAGALHLEGWEVEAVDRDESSLNGALEKGWISKGLTEIPEFLDYDLVVVALPLPHLVDSLTRFGNRIRDGAILTDVGSLKTDICARAGNFKDKGAFFVGGHPMTGSEKSGFAVADPRLFQGFPYVLTPLPDCPGTVVEALSRLLERLGAKVILREPAEHDAEVALVSHIPHLLAVALALAANDLGDSASSALQLAGRSFREITRIADSSPEMWREILTKNAPAVLQGLELWQEKLTQLSDYVRQGDGDGIAEAFRQAHDVRRSMEKLNSI
ncbi:prephenate dehydrogenase [Paradesulfitobacterium ferrireducens]|uniref:prephenate dehydrogenase n=1 Tax=Paradesulfitobacterium ferrireducens TaxID=2816476 RepID=UPI001A8F40C2|nr:prephenate dehydrogenase/arogenate dehydrogenase family protein [Paradesulfitobacterium ferrireducens]